MSTISDKQLAANQQNALKGGPKTSEGKAVVAQNAIKHGFFVKDVVVNAGLIQESEEEFESLRASFTESLTPENKAQEELVQNIAFNVWRKRRLMRAETGEILKANAYLSDNQDAIQHDADDTNESFYEILSIEALFRYKLNNRFQVKKMVEAMALACAEHEANGSLSEDTFKSLKILFTGDEEFGFFLHFARNTRSHEGNKQAALIRLKEKLNMLKERQQYLHDRDLNQKRNASAANYVPEHKTVDKFLKYSVFIDKQIKNDLNLLRALQGKQETEVES